MKIVGLVARTMVNAVVINTVIAAQNVLAAALVAKCLAFQFPGCAALLGDARLTGTRSHQLAQLLATLLSCLL